MLGVHVEAEGYVGIYSVPWSVHDLEHGGVTVESMDVIALVF